MNNVKDTARALVRIGYDGTVEKTFRASGAQERFDNEVRVLRYLEQRECPFVPRLLHADRENLRIVTSNCGARVEYASDRKVEELFAELEQYGVRHDDPYLRNITYRASDGRFCVIDFEFATILDPSSQEQASLPCTEESIRSASYADSLLRLERVTFLVDELLAETPA